MIKEVRNVKHLDKTKIYAVSTENRNGKVSIVCLEPHKGIYWRIIPEKSNIPEHNRLQNLVRSEKFILDNMNFKGGMYGTLLRRTCFELDSLEELSKIKMMLEMVK